jgi:hypothetical protein
VGLFNRLFSKASAPAPPPVRAPRVGDHLGDGGSGTSGVLGVPLATLADVPLDGDETLFVVGESYRQDALWRLVGGQRANEVRVECVAALVPEPNNEYDPNAISVLIRGERVGYLSRADAVEYLPGLKALIANSRKGRVMVHGWIVGGGRRLDGLGRLGVFLDHDPADFGIAEEEPAHATLSDLPAGYGFRTGLSSARATDLEDDSYDLSWLDELSPNVAIAIQQLRRLLETIDDAVDRHYAFAELERRLYGCRDAFASALADYDKVCLQHDAAMDDIRAALLAKFGRLPIFETYKQAAIRWQKAKDWESVRQWAERGIAVYGEDAVTPEVVEDLRKRLAHATAKMEAAKRPRSARPPRATATAPSVVEALVCQICGSTFDRVRTRGRKPHACPTCRLPK